MSIEELFSSLEAYLSKSDKKKIKDFMDLPKEESNNDQLPDEPTIQDIMDKLNKI